MLREARLLQALEDTPARGPQVLAAREDEGILGAPFYVMTGRRACRRWRTSQRDRSRRVKGLLVDFGGVLTTEAIGMTAVLHRGAEGTLPDLEELLGSSCARSPGSGRAGP